MKIDKKKIDKLLEPTKFDSESTVNSIRNAEEIISKPFIEGSELSLIERLKRDFNLSSKKKKTKKKKTKKKKHKKKSKKKQKVKSKKTKRNKN